VRIIFSSHGWEDYLHWQATDASVLHRLNALIEDCRRSPFRGLGKPEPLKNDRQGYWSRRITLEDRLVYRVSGSGEAQALEIVQCRFHY
jgi:toxin YoeB